MSKKKKGQGPRRPEPDERPIDRDYVVGVDKWFQRMKSHALRAVTLADTMSLCDVRASNDLFRALVKYVENVQESMKQLDAMDKRILEALLEIPNEPTDQGDVSWKDLKGMRDKLAHQFWAIDLNIMWATVREDFPKLLGLLSTLFVKVEPVGGGQETNNSPLFRGSDLLALDPSDPSEPPQPGKALVFLSFDIRGKPITFRVARSDDELTLLVWSSEGGTFQLFKHEISS